MASATVFAATCHLHIMISNRARQLLSALLLTVPLNSIHSLHPCMLVHNTFREYMLTIPRMKCTKNLKNKRKKEKENLTCLFPPLST